MVNQIEFAGKKRSFKRIKMWELQEFQENLAEIQSDVTISTKDKYLKMGKLVGKILDPFEPEEMMELEPDEFQVIQQINLLYNYVKTKRSKSEIDDLMNKIVEAGIDGQLAFMSNPSDFQPK